MGLFYSWFEPIKGGFTVFRKHIFAWGLNRFDPVMHRKYAPRKQSLLEGMSGAIVEIGPGNGTNFGYYEKGSRIVAVEPNRYLHKYLRRKAAVNGLDLELHGTYGESLPNPDESVDAAVSTLVLCSVLRPADVLSEIRRVLKPGGCFVFIEHVSAWDNQRLKRMQERIRPAWERLFDGCHPDRRTWNYLEEAGFRHLRIDRFNLSVPVVAPHISGIAIK